MLRNYLKIALRNLKKNKGFSAINILGLAIGIATCLLITLYVLDELSYDRHHEKADRIYRVNAAINFGGTLQNLAVAPDPLAFTMVNDYPQVENAVRFRNYGASVVRKGEQNIKEEKIISVDATLFDVFTLPMIQGNPKTALRDPNTVVITEEIAEKYFGTSQAVGQVLRFDNQTDYKVTGVIKNLPPNSHFDFDFFVSMAGSEEARRNNWVSFNFNTYLLLQKGTRPETMERKFGELMEKYLFPQAADLMGITKESFEKSGSYIKFSLTPLTDIHLRSDQVAELGPNSDIQFVYIFSAVALLILVIACLNFMNLSTARSANRAKEVGVRKVLGTQRAHLINQFLTESVLMSLIAFIIGYVIAFLMLPYFNDLAAKELSLSIAQHPVLLPVLSGCPVIVGLLAGSYPAFYLSSFQPIKVLKGRLGSGFKSSYFRSTMVVFQFSISIALIIGTIVIYRQLNYIQNKKLGFNKEQVLIIKDTYVLNEQTEVFRNEALRLPHVVSATVSGYLPVPSSRSEDLFFPEGVMDPKKSISMQNWSVDVDYVATMGMEIIKGRNFSKDLLTDSNTVIINEAAAQVMGLQDPIGKKVGNLQDVTDKNSMRYYTIIGVVKNFNYESLRQNIEALCMKLGRATGNISFRMQTGNVMGVVKNMESLWKKMAPGQAFTYSFLDEDFNAVYRAEQRMGTIFISFAVLAIFIACLGLFGLATYAAEQRTREIGIRKVLGASVGSIAGMLSRDFLKLVLIAALIVFPIAWWAMHQWLEDFAFRITISWWIFVFAAAVALLIALLTVSFQAIKAAVANPVKSLRTE